MHCTLLNFHFSLLNDSVFRVVMFTSLELPVPRRLRLGTGQLSERIHAAAKQAVPMATPMAGVRNQ
jgi:hypothetical protein